MDVSSIDEIRALFSQKGGCQYSGEPVTLLEHALQCARLAEEAGAGAELITACLLHDLGHLANDLGDTPTLRGKDDRHQFHGARVLKAMFPEAVRHAVLLHVDAKRYLCATEPGYWERLSQDSKRSLELQGGKFSAGEAAKFIARPHAADALRLRRWDDGAKVAGVPTPGLERYLGIANSCVTATVR
jgi:phosphonate degradation associated HDIG domain protein